MWGVRKMEESPRQPLYDILEHISDGFVALDKNWRYVYVNRRGAEMLGRRPEDLIGRHIWTEFPEGIGQPFYKAYYRAMEEQVSVQIEEYYPPLDHWFENRIYPFPEGLAMFFTETTQRKKTEKTLEQERKTAQKYLEVSNTIMLVIGKDQRVSLINKKGCQILGYREEEIIGKDWIDNFLPQRTRADIKDAFSRVLAGELAPFEYFENPILTKDGEERLIAWHSTLLTDEGGHITGTLSSGEDMTERKRAEEALLVKEHLLSESQRIAHVGTWLYDMTGRITWSDETYRIFGVSSDTFTPNAESFLNLIHPDDRPAMQAWINACLAEEKPGELEFRTITPDGTVRFISGRGELMYDAVKRPTHMAGTAQDITERKQAEKSLQLSRERHLNTLETMLEGCQIIDFDWRYIYVNNAAARHGLKRKEELLGHKMADLYPGIENTEMFAALRRCMDERVPQRMENEFTYPDGNKRWFDLSVQPLPEG